MTINAQTSAARLILFRSNVNINADTTANRIEVDGNGTLSLNSGVLRGDLYINTLVGNPIVERNGGLLDVGVLSLRGQTTIELVPEDRVSDSLRLSSGASLFLDRPDSFQTLSVGDNCSVRFRVGDGQMEGLSLEQLEFVSERCGCQEEIEGTSLLHIEFTESDQNGLNWGLRLAGNQLDYLQSLLDLELLTFSEVGGLQPLALSGQRSLQTSSLNSIGLIYDAQQYGNFTYLGFVNVNTIPEPGAFSVFALFTTAIFTKRRKRLG